MFVAGISTFDSTAIHFIPPDPKVNANFYINKVLKAPFEKDVLRLFGKNTNSALHHNSNRAHTAAITVQWLEKTV